MESLDKILRQFATPDLTRLAVGYSLMVSSPSDLTCVLGLSLGGCRVRGHQRDSDLIPMHTFSVRFLTPVTVINSLGGLVEALPMQLITLANASHF